MRAFPTLLCAAATAAVVSAQTRTGLNEKIFFNQNHTTATTRVSATAVDTIYFMQPAAFHSGYGRLSGWRGILQDQNQATAEQVRLAVVKYAADGVSPDITASGIVAGSSATFTLFGSGTGAAAYIWTLTLTTPVTIPTKAGIAVTLPAPRSWPNDGVSIHYQNGTTLRLPAGVTAPRWTFYKTAQNTLGNFSTVGSTFRLGFLLEKPVVQVFNASTAYGSLENLFGPESLWASGTRGDKIGFRFGADAFASQFVIPMLSSKLAAAPLTTPFGSVLIDPAGAVAVPPMQLDTKGGGLTPAFALKGPLQLAVQGAFIDVKNLKVVTSDAQLFQVK